MKPVRFLLRRRPPKTAFPRSDRPLSARLAPDVVCLIPHGEIVFRMTFSPNGDVLAVVSIPDT